MDCPWTVHGLEFGCVHCQKKFHGIMEHPWSPQIHVDSTRIIWGSDKSSHKVKMHRTEKLASRYRPRGIFAMVSLVWAASMAELLWFMGGAVAPVWCYNCKTEWKIHHKNHTFLFLLFQSQGSEIVHTLVIRLCLAILLYFLHCTRPKSNFPDTTFWMKKRT